MTVIKIATARASIDYNGKNYKFPHCVSWTINNPVENGRLCSPQGTTNGIKTKSNTSSPASAAGVVRELEKDLLLVLKKIFDNNEDVRFTVFDIETGRQVVQENSNLRQDPMNAAIAEGDDNFNVNLDFICSPHNQKNSFLEV